MEIYEERRDASLDDQGILRRVLEVAALVTATFDERWGR